MEGYKARYFIREGGRKKLEVTEREFIVAEARAGFFSKEPGRPATGGFSGHGIEGSVKYTKERVKRLLDGDVQFQPKSRGQKKDCINRNAEYQCPNESTLEAVSGTATVRCCTEEDCKEKAAEIARLTGNFGAQKGKRK